MARQEVTAAAALAARLKAEWEARAVSPSSHFFIASHPGWNDPSRWEAQARADVETFLQEVDRDALRAEDILEIGCGVGRLALHLAPLCRSYTGIDISPSFLAEARARCRGAGNARFMETGGLGIPGAAADRRYGIVLAAAVFIHCVRSIIQSMLASALEVTRPGGELRFQLRAEPADPEGIVSVQQAEAAHHAMEAVERIDVADKALAETEGYLGTRFRYAEARRFLGSLGASRVDLLRLDHAIIYCRLVR